MISEPCGDLAVGYGGGECRNEAEARAALIKKHSHRGIDNVSHGLLLSLGSFEAALPRP